MVNYEVQRLSDTDDSLIIGVEMEFSFHLGPSVIKYLYQQWEKDFSINPRKAQEFILNELLSLSPYIKTFYLDTEGWTELLTDPEPLDLHLFHWGGYESIFFLLNNILGHAVQQHDLKTGIHHNIDKSSINDFGHLLDCIFAMREVILLLSLRKGESEELSNIEWMLGDALGEWTEEDMRDAFASYKEDLIDSFNKSNIYNGLGMRINSANLDIVSFNWYSSTFDIKEFFCQLLLTESLINFSNLGLNPDLESYKNFIEEDSKYDLLLETITKVMVKHYKTEQIKNADLKAIILNSNGEFKELNSKG
jgi:hypothetical protein